MNDFFQKKTRYNISYSVRRFYVDTFFMKRVDCFHEGAKILDIGGKKVNKRGLFNIHKYPLEVKYANLSQETEPDYLCDAASIPVEDASFDGVVMGELLEHVPDPELVIQEAFRILKPGGKLLVTVPFMFHIHADPNDYGRYTNQFWERMAKMVGFSEVEIEYQGGFYAVTANLVKVWALLQMEHSKSRIWRMFVKNLSEILSGFLLKKDVKTKLKKSEMYRGNTLGFGLVFVK